MFNFNTKTWAYTEGTKYISIYDDKHDNNLTFSLNDKEMKEWAEFILKCLENK